jgi:hypothetical protein
MQGSFITFAQAIIYPGRLVGNNKEKIMMIIAPLLGIIVIGLGFIVVRWLIKKYFHNDTSQYQTSSKQASSSTGLAGDQSAPKVTKPITAPVTSDGSTSSTITESNNALSKARFDGINLNPEHKENVQASPAKTMDDDLSKLELPELAHESNANLVRVKDTPPGAKK